MNRYGLGGCYSSGKAWQRKCSEILSADTDFDEGPLPRRF
jgi:hypothetical protein